MEKSGQTVLCSLISGMTISDSLSLPASLNLTISMMCLRWRVMDYLHFTCICIGKKAPLQLFQYICMIMQIYCAQVLFEIALLKRFSSLDKHFHIMWHYMKQNALKIMDKVTWHIIFSYNETLLHLDFERTNSADLVMCSRSTPTAHRKCLFFPNLLEHIWHQETHQEDQ